MELSPCSHAPHLNSILAKFMSEQNPMEAVIESLLAGVRREQVAAADAFADQAAVAAAVAAIQACKLADFDRALVRPMDRVVSGVLSKELHGNYRAQFLFSKHQFVETHFRRLVEEIDGMACCADRTRTILRALANHLVHQKPIVFNYAQEYTFHLPVRVFRTELDIVSFFDALLELYYGKAEAFIAIQANLRTTAATLPVPAE
jgi:multidrug efflux pump subunit AcrA (membrane-fusion protein)